MRAVRLGDQLGKDGRVTVNPVNRRSPFPANALDDPLAGFMLIGAIGVDRHLLAVAQARRRLGGRT